MYTIKKNPLMENYVAPVVSTPSITFNTLTISNNTQRYGVTSTTLITDYSVGAPSFKDPGC